MISRYYLAGDVGERIPRMDVTAGFAKGSSGSPVLDRYGRVVGMVKETRTLRLTGKGEEPGDPQMVIRSCVTAESILTLLGG